MYAIVKSKERWRRKQSRNQTDFSLTSRCVAPGETSKSLTGIHSENGK